MRYLYGDSTPFPLPFDFLRTLEAFMTAATRVLLLEHAVRRLELETKAAKEERALGLAVVSKFHESVLRSLSESAVPQHAFAIDYAQRMAERAVGLIGERRSAVKDGDDRGEAAVAREHAKAAQETRALLSTFFQSAELPTQSTRLATSLVDGKPEARAHVVYPSAIGASFVVGTSKLGAWSAPRKLGELAGHLELSVGVKKSWIGGKVSREAVRLDDCILSGAELDGDAATLTVRKKLDQKDHLVFRLRRENGAVTGEVENPGDPNAAQLPPALEGADLPPLERLWIALESSLGELATDRARLVRLTLDDEDVFEQSLAHELVERLAGVLGPTAQEVLRKSPNQEELSLKREVDGGRREEIYLKRATLLTSLQALPHDGRAVFAPLGLADWVPPATGRPPEATLSDVEVLSSIDLEDDAG